MSWFIPAQRQKILFIGSGPGMAHIKKRLMSADSVAARYSPPSHIPNTLLWIREISLRSFFGAPNEGYRPNCFWLWTPAASEMRRKRCLRLQLQPLIKYPTVKPAGNWIFLTHSLSLSLALSRSLSLSLSFMVRKAALPVSVESQQPFSSLF